MWAHFFEHELIECEVQYTRAGFRFKTKRSLGEGRLPAQFINQDRHRNQRVAILKVDSANNSILFATHELVCDRSEARPTHGQMVANNRLRASEQEILDISMRIIAELQDTVTNESGRNIFSQPLSSGELYICSEAVSLH